MAVEVSIEAMELAPVGYTAFLGENLLFPSTPVTTLGPGDGEDRSDPGRLCDLGREIGSCDPTHGRHGWCCSRP